MGQIKIPRATTAQRTGITPDVGELIYDTTNGGVYKGDGATVGGVALGGGSGTVTSVAASVPTFLSVSGSPITTSGTLAVTLSGTVRLYKTKIGDGVTSWTSLPYAQLGTFGGSGGGGGAGSGEIVDLGDRTTGSEILDIGQRV